ncbi:hypothetical protein BDN72DRAFT_848908 [Pluteus cervinus]|uniref:Uncharacterized protein n=1 Tax=Pluteus cervinus TaxID=181527 RepID=A0ACD3A993_9AGAR|nr:hypothetical protein BDN72DRAFT_848908 [Pluteus cervinus]
MAQGTMKDIALDLPTNVFIFNEELFSADSRLQPLINLRRLKLSLQQSKFPRVNLLPWVTHIVSNLSHPEKMEEIILPCAFFTHYEFKTRSGDGWDALDEALVSPRLSNLRSVEFVLVQRDPNEERHAKRIVRAVPELFRRTIERGILRVGSYTRIGYTSARECWHNA